jgi:Flp pilus assembly secretin CpaC
LTLSDIPGVKVSQMNTQIDASFNQPLFLCGLLKENDKKSIKGLPFLQSLPILGALFSSTNYLKDRSELVIILYPHNRPPQAPVTGSEYFFNANLKLSNEPPARKLLPSETILKLKQSVDYPWNIF